MTNPDLKEEYEKYTTQNLLSLRALGDGLFEDAHVAIELVLAERGIAIPPRPQKTVIVESPQKGSRFLNLALGIFFLCLAQVLFQVLKEYRLVGIAFALASGVFFLFRWLRQPESRIVRERENALARIGTDGFTELMFVAADGDIQRAQDLINYGAQIDARDDTGATALMYAAHGGHAEMVSLLLRSGATASLRTKRGQCALELAIKSRHDAVVVALQARENSGD